MIDTPKDGVKGLVKKAMASEFPSRTRLIEAHPQKAIVQGFIPSLCLLHGVLQERHKFKPVGWAFDYEFNESDLQLSFQILYDLLNGPETESQMEIIIYLIGQGIYGGHQASDGMDYKILEQLVAEFLNPANILDGGKRLKALIDGLSRHTDPNILGIHPNINQKVNFRRMEENVGKMLKIQDRKDLVAQEVRFWNRFWNLKITKSHSRPLNWTATNWLFGKLKESLLNYRINLILI